MILPMMKTPRCNVTHLCNVLGQRNESHWHCAVVSWQWESIPIFGAIENQKLSNRFTSGFMSSYRSEKLQFPNTVMFILIPYNEYSVVHQLVSVKWNVCWIGGISHQYVGKCISNDLLLCIHMTDTTKPILTQELNRICFRESILQIKTDSQHYLCILKVEVFGINCQALLDTNGKSL